MSSATAPPVIVVDDDEAIREGLLFLFESVGLSAETFSSADAFLARMPIDRSGCVVTDVRMPGTSGLDLRQRLVERGIDVPVIVLTGYGDVRMAVRALRTGAFDFVEKPFNDEELLDSVRRALEFAAAEIDQSRRRAEAARRLSSLTNREREVLEQILNGERNKRIAHKLGISNKTVEFHRANLMTKMGAQTPAELIRAVVTTIEPKGTP